MILQWVRDRDITRFINGNQIRNYFIRGTIRPGTDQAPIENIVHEGSGYVYAREYPNREWGYGQLNLYNTFEAMRQL